jgi:hypothetical protein
MLVPVSGGVAQLQKRNRTYPQQVAMLATVPMPSVYIFSVGLREWRGVGGGRQFVIPPCPKGKRYSDPVEIPALCLSEIDLADGGNNMGTCIDSAMSGEQKIGNEVKHMMGVADDIIGIHSTVPGLELNSTNGAWFGVFVSRDEEPSDEEIEQAESNLREMMQLIYAAGAEKVGAGEKVLPNDRKRYNEAAEYLRVAPLWGSLDHTMDQCPECGEDIRKGANVCKHCNLAIDEASVAARAKKRAKQNEQMLKDDEGAKEEKLSN